MHPSLCSPVQSEGTTLGSRWWIWFKRPWNLPFRVLWYVTELKRKVKFGNIDLWVLYIDVRVLHILKPEECPFFILTGPVLGERSKWPEIYLSPLSYLADPFSSFRTPFQFHLHRDLLWSNRLYHWVLYICLSHSDPGYLTAFTSM